MTETERTQLRAAALLQLREALPFALSTGVLHAGVKLAGFASLTPEELTSELQALIEMGHVVKTGVALNGAVKNYKLTEAGRVALADASL